ncbi:glycoside hydrolase family 88 protein [Pedobacter sp. MC2016-14]|uniref:glycoside hydrolase family 88 protein n=1 Tax=Pedobacter sp. MC2016-14 TaxID=2897327 RepID=UPI001E5030E4|nr:glycoside hydrolase family 88 protein [Pedobacter sp. MC2016-14]MCD0489253.1 glycoside hydrolase family 88 protein [Pedobacter sp. MC2016-14]
MNFKNYILNGLLCAATVFMPFVSFAQQRKSNTAAEVKFINTELSDAVKQYKYLTANTKADRFPKAYFPKNDSLATSASEWWCSGFYPGTLWYLYEGTKDPATLKAAIGKLADLKKEEFNKDTHDLGFMMYCSFGNAYRIAHTAAYKEVLINSARSLASRFDPKVGLIKSWNSKDPSEYLVIIDNMMNLELLFWATQATGDSSYYKIAVTHADHTLKNHFRKDYSSYHVVNYDGTTGAVKQQKTHQGYADASAWARGQAWGLYGYTLMYRATKNKKYLEQAKNISSFILNHPRLPKDKIPYWDFDAPNIPNAPRDASAAAVMASAWIELAGYTTGQASARYLNTAKEIVHTLASPAYKAKPGTYGGFLLMHSVGHLPAKSEVDVALSYADYYYVECLIRLKKQFTK